MTRAVHSLCVCVAGLIMLPASLQGDEVPGVDLRAAVERARACVVLVECRDRSSESAAAVLSAVAIDDGLLVTVGLRADTNRRVCVRDCFGIVREADWVGSDEESGLTLLRIEPGAVPAAEIEQDLPDVGSAALVVGNPFGLNHSVTLGNISGVGRTVAVPGGVGRGLIQFTAPVYPGDSGGLLADQDGRMVGIISTALGDPQVTALERYVTGIGFAIPAREAQRIARRLRDGEPVDRGYLGVTVQDEEPGGGVRITSLASGSPAELAGLRAGDVLRAVGDEAVTSVDDLAARIERLAPGTELRLRIARGSEEMQITVTLGERKTSAARPRWQPIQPWADRWGAPPGRARVRDWLPALSSDGAMLGVETQPVSESLAKSLGLPSTDGALVHRVVPGSPAERAGLRASDLIAAVDNEPVQTPAQLRELIQKAGAGTKVTLKIVRDGETQQVEATLARGWPGPAGDEPWIWPPIPGPSWIPEPTAQRIEALERRVQELESRVQQLEQRLRKAEPHEQRDPSALKESK